MKKVYLETFGCQMNVSDSERVASQLEQLGYAITDSEESADIVLLNTCSVREKAEQKLYTRAGQLKHSDGPKKIVGVMGCVAQLEGESLFKKDRGIDFVIGTKAVGRVGDAIVAAVDGEKRFMDLGEREEDYDWLPIKSQRHSPYVAFVPIIEGCNKFCTYCIVPFSRGREKSLPASEVIRHVLELRREGVKEIHLIGQNVNSYRPTTDSGLEKFKGKSQFARLLRAVAATGIERIKFTTSFPRDYNSDITDAINENENLCNWVHLPVQSGSDDVLKAMKRGHTVESYKKKIDDIRSSPRNISLSTDMIVGFPGETEKDFQGTCDLFEYCGYESAYLFKYSPRPGTPAAEMEDDVLPQEKKMRFLELEKIQRRIQQESFARKTGTLLQVLAERKGARDGQLTGHSTCQAVVNFEAGIEKLGSIVDVKITEAKTNTLFGEIQ
ncbi:MAG: tRNA (N6-isopentenyl adenosine(37)-C2)-methylthiotransferase MiaB [Pyrinomonadaceae bacterium]|nr:tRNA (N6-isopentenyl adenosine(37)-C2)-methylthiotransferase MiaB [Pyrinomonadaceae bacterium]